MYTTVCVAQDTPCKDCPDRYPACSDHCKKPDFLKWKEERARIREAKKAYRCSIWKHGEPYQRRKPTRPKGKA